MVVRPLRKHALDGTLYVRRPEVEAEISLLEALDGSQLEACCRLWPASEPGFVSTEALLYFVRQANSQPAHQERLFHSLMSRFHRRLPRAESKGGESVSLTTLNIREEIRDAFVDLLLADRQGYEEQLDFYEAQFNKAVAFDRMEVQRQHWKAENRQTALEAENDEVRPEVELSVGQYDPFDAEELDKRDYRRLLDAAIDSLPVLQRRIVEMLRNETPIESGDPDVTCISKALGKSEKTIRTHRDKAYATLRRRLERKGKT